jgi:hypothetical protein
MRLLRQSALLLGLLSTGLPQTLHAADDEIAGDWQGTNRVVQIIPTTSVSFRAHLLQDFNLPDTLVATLDGKAEGSTATFSGDGWTASVADGVLKIHKGDEAFELKRVTRHSPTENAKPPAGAVVVFDGKSFDAWTRQKDRQWDQPDGPAQWKLTDGVMESEPNARSIITKRQFGDCELHVEFRTLGSVNSGVFLQARYEVGISESYGQLDGPICGALDNCTPPDSKPRIRASFPPGQWQTLDIVFRAPCFDTGGKKTSNARVTVRLNGVKLYEDRELDPPRGAAKRLGEAATGPLMLQEHGEPIQFRNIWLVESQKPTGKATGFYHPGVLINRTQLELVRGKVAAGAEPWKTAFETAKASEFGALEYTPKPWQTVECGPRSTPNLGCTDERRDAQAACTQALLWFFTTNQVYAQNAIKIMNAWSSTLTGGHKLANANVQAAWSSEVWPRAAEIIRYTDAGWAEADIAQFKGMLATQYVPVMLAGSCENGNKELSMSEALINIGVFNDDREIFDAGVKMWRGRAPAYIYLLSDGAKPVQPVGCDMAIWGNKGYTTPLVDGLLQETCRDSGHANLGFSAMVNAAETARQQGLDLYAEQGKRIMAALEYQAQFLPPHNAPVPENLEFTKQPTWEIAFNHFHNRLGHPLPKTAALLPTNRPTGVKQHMVWETLTHAEVGAIGLPPIHP